MIDLRYRDLNLVKALIKGGASVNLKNRYVDGDELVPPLYYATAVQDAEIVEYLLKSGKAFHLQMIKSFMIEKTRNFVISFLTISFVYFKKCFVKRGIILYKAKRRKVHMLSKLPIQINLFIQSVIFKLHSIKLGYVLIFQTHKNG